MPARTSYEKEGQKSISIGPTKFGWDMSIHGWDITTSGFKTGRLPYWNCSSGFAILIYFFVIDVLFCIGVQTIQIELFTAELWRWVDFQIGRHPWSRKSTSSLGFSDDTCLRKSKSIHIGLTKFEEISQSTAEYHYFRFRFWLVYRHWHGISVCVSLLNFIQIELSPVEFWRHTDLQDGGQSAILDLIWVIRIYSFGDIAIFTYRRFGSKIPIHVIFCLGGHSGIFPNDVIHRLTPKRTVLRGNTSRVPYSVKIGPAVRHGRRIEKKDRTVMKVTKWSYFASLGRSPHCTNWNQKLHGG